MAVKSAVKRLCAAFVACVVMWYTVITASVFRVHGAFSDFSFGTALDGLTDYLYSNSRKVLEAFSSVTGDVPLYLLDAGYSIFGADGIADHALAIAQDIRDSGNATVINFSTSQGFVGYYTFDNSSDINSGSLYTRDLSSCLSNTYFNLYSTSDFSLVFRALPAPGYGVEDYSISLSMGIRSSLNGGYFDYSFTSNIPFIPEFTLYMLGDTLSKTYNPMSSVSISFNIVRGGPVSLPSSPSNLIDYLVPVSVTSTSFSASPSILGADRTHPANFSISNSFPGWPTGNTNSLSYDNFENTYNYYNNYITPYVQEKVGDQYTIYDVDYYSQIVQDNQPVETTSPGSGVIIIDPFTLPPEWVQSDVVEMQTEHYIVPFESMVADPFDYLVSPYTETVTETVRGATKSVPISPPTPQYRVWPRSGNVQETAVGFINLGYDLLSRSGLGWVIGVAVFGLCVGTLLL